MSTRFISAGAGTGKTYQIMETIKSALKKGIEADQVVATTFTVAAAAEIRQRVQKTFLEADETNMAYATAAINIGTVDSICGSLLRLFAFEAGISPDLQVIEPDDASKLLSETLDRVLPESYIEELVQLERRFGIDRFEDSVWKQHIKKVVDEARSNGIESDALPATAKLNAETLSRCLGTPLANPDSAMIDVLESEIPELRCLQEQKFQKNTDGFIQSCEELLVNIRKQQVHWSDWIKVSRGGYGKNAGEHGERIQAEAQRWNTHPRLHRDIES